MKFVDEAEITVLAGRGGNGIVSFRREKFVPFGGPDGGDGGDGGSIYLLGSSALNTLVDFRKQSHFKAKSGKSGEGVCRKGRSGEDLILKVPIGTQVYNLATNELIADITHNEEKILVCKGGWHGIGNFRHRSSVNRAPRQATKGTEGEERRLKLELKLLADVGLVGFPNAGKSTLMRQLTNSRTKIGNYPYTTLHPHIGVYRFSESKECVIADLPGLAEGSASGSGLGVKFLRHVSRCKILVMIISVEAQDEAGFNKILNVLLEQIVGYDQALLSKPIIVCMNKCDLIDEAMATSLRNSLNTYKVFDLVAITGQGCEALMQEVGQYVSS